MRKIVPLIFIIVICISCEDDVLENLDTRFYVPQLKLERGNLEVELNFIDPRPFTSYLGGPPSAPDVIDVYMSTDNENFTFVESVDSTTTKLTVDGLTNGQLYYFRMDLSRKNSEVFTSTARMTIPSLSGNTETLISNLNQDWSGFSVSKNRSLLTFRDRTDGLRTLKLLDVATGNVTLVENDSYGVGWANNASKFAYFNVGTPSLIKQLDVITGEEEILIEDLSDYRQSNIVYGADDQSVYFLAGLIAGNLPMQFWEIDLETKESSVLIDLESMGFIADAILSSTSDGTNIYLEGRDTATEIHGLYQLNLETEQLTLILESTWGDSWPSISPDGQKLAFISNRSGDEELWLLHISSGKLNQLTGGEFSEYDFDRTKISWFSNNEISAAIAGNGFNRSLLRINVN